MILFSVITIDSIHNGFDKLCVIAVMIMMLYFILTPLITEVGTVARVSNLD